MAKQKCVKNKFSVGDLRLYKILFLTLKSQRYIDYILKRIEILLQFTIFVEDMNKLFYLNRLTFDEILFFNMTFYRVCLWCTCLETLRFLPWKCRRHLFEPCSVTWIRWYTT